MTGSSEADLGFIGSYRETHQFTNGMELGSKRDCFSKVNWLQEIWAIN